MWHGISAALPLGEVWGGKKLLKGKKSGNAAKRTPPVLSVKYLKRAMKSNMDGDQRLKLSPNFQLKKLHELSKLDSHLPLEVIGMIISRAGKASGPLATIR